MKGNTDTIKHWGTITAISSNTLRVTMLQSSACSSCHAAKLCQSSESKEKEVDVTCTDVDQYAVGQKVLLVGSVRQGLKATLWAYVLPIVILIAVLLLCVKFGLSETVSALLSLASLVPYYVVLYFFRDRFRKRFSFSIQKSM